MRRSSERPEILRARGEILSDLSRHERALSDLRKVRPHERPSTQAAYALALALSGDVRQAVEAVPRLDVDSDAVTLLRAARVMKEAGRDSQPYRRRDLSTAGVRAHRVPCLDRLGHVRVDRPGLLESQKLHFNRPNCVSVPGMAKSPLIAAVRENDKDESVGDYKCARAEAAWLLLIRRDDEHREGHLCTAATFVRRCARAGLLSVLEGANGSPRSADVPSGATWPAPPTSPPTSPRPANPCRAEAAARRLVADEHARVWRTRL